MRSLKKIGRKYQGGWIWPALAAGASLVGGILGSKKSAKGQQETNETNIQLQREQQAWEANMSNTAIQRRIQDYTAAGLNPMLAYQSEASTPTVSAARIDNPDKAWEDTGKHVGSASQAAMQAKAIQETILNTRADTQKKMAEKILTDRTAEKVNYETAITANSAGNTHLLTQELNMRVNKLRHEIESIIQQRKITELTEEQQRRLMPLLLEAQELQNKGASLGLPEKAASAEFWEKLQGAGKGVPMLRDILQMIRSAK